MQIIDAILELPKIVELNHFLECGAYIFPTSFFLLKYALKGPKCIECSIKYIEIIWMLLKSY
jgi:hypothetical protein